MSKYVIFAIPTFTFTFYFHELTHFFRLNETTLLSVCSKNILVRLLTVNMTNSLTPKNPKMCDPILVTLLKMRPHYSQSTRKNATLSSGTSPLTSYEAVPPPPPTPPRGKSKAATRRSLKRRVTYQIGVHTLPDSFLCLHEKLSSIVISLNYCCCSRCGRLLLHLSPPR